MTTPSSDQRIKRKLGRANYTDMDAAFLIAKKMLWGELTQSMSESEGSL